MRKSLSCLFSVVIFCAPLSVWAPHILSLNISATLGFVTNATLHQQCVLNPKHMWWCREVCRPIRRSRQNTVNIWTRLDSYWFSSTAKEQFFFFTTAKGNEMSNICLMIELKLPVKLTSPSLFTHKSIPSSDVKSTFKRISAFDLLVRRSGTFCSEMHTLKWTTLLLGYNSD